MREILRKTWIIGTGLWLGISLSVSLGTMLFDAPFARENGALLLANLLAAGLNFELCDRLT